MTDEKIVAAAAGDQHAAQPQEAAQALTVWRAIAEEATGLVLDGVKHLCLTEEMCILLGSALEAQPAPASYTKLYGKCQMLEDMVKELSAKPRSQESGHGRDAELQFNATRLRNVARLVGLESAIPEDDETLDAARGSVLGMIAGALRNAAQAAPAVPDGFALVPKELTREMRAAWDKAPTGEDDDVNMREAYRALIAAAPSAPAPRKEGE